MTDALLLFVGLALLIKGADLLVSGASSIAGRLGIPALVIGLTVVSFGTSLPEIATSVMASLKGERDIAVGNVVGSNLFNLLILALDDVFYRQGPLLAAADRSHAVAILAVVAMNALFLIGLTYRVLTKRFAVAWDTGGIAAVYVAAVVLAYRLSR